MSFLSQDEKDKNTYARKFFTLPGDGLALLFRSIKSLYTFAVGNHDWQEYLQEVTPEEELNDLEEMPDVILHKEPWSFWLNRLGFIGALSYLVIEAPLAGIIKFLDKYSEEISLVFWIALGGAALAATAGTIMAFYFPEALSAIATFATEWGTIAAWVGESQLAQVAFGSGLVFAAADVIGLVLLPPAKIIAWLSQGTPTPTPTPTSTPMQEIPMEPIDANANLVPSSTVSEPTLAQQFSNFNRGNIKPPVDAYNRHGKSIFQGLNDANPTLDSDNRNTY